MEQSHEARIIQRLGDRPGISFLFGAMLQQSIVGIAVRFHGDNDESVTIYKATKEKLHDHSIGSLEIGVLRHRRCTRGGGYCHIWAI